MYNSYFDNQIRNRGFKYYKAGKVTDLKENKNKVTALVNGTESYYVEVVFNETDDRIIEHAKCDCPYYSDGEKLCKHIYAVILCVKYNEEREKRENIEDEKEVENLKNECQKYIKICENDLNDFKKRLKNNRKYLNREIYNDYLDWHNSYFKNLKSHVELANKDSIYKSFYQARLQSLKKIHEIILENSNKMIERVQKNKGQALQIEHQREHKTSILLGLISLIKAFMPNKADEKNEELKIGDWVEIIPEGEFGEILNIYREDNKCKYEVLFDTEPNDEEDIDIFRREELRKIRIN